MLKNCFGTGGEAETTRVNAAYEDDEDQLPRILDDMKWKQLHAIHDLTLHPN